MSTGGLLQVLAPRKERRSGFDRRGEWRGKDRRAYSCAADPRWRSSQVGVG